jgi:hypothetical protein
LQCLGNNLVLERGLKLQHISPMRFFCEIRELINSPIPSLFVIIREIGGVSFPSPYLLYQLLILIQSYSDLVYNNSTHSWSKNTS